MRLYIQIVGTLSVLSIFVASACACVGTFFWFTPEHAHLLMLGFKVGWVVSLVGFAMLAPLGLYGLWHKPKGQM
jgi:uncharacterized membrane protein YbhN (UPF0104 family)